MSGTEMIANDSIAFEVEDLQLRCMLKQELAFSDLFDIFRVLGRLRICSWQEFQLYSTPIISPRAEYQDYASRYYQKEYANSNLIDIELYNKNELTGAKTQWVEAVHIQFEKKIPDLRRKLKQAISQLRDDYEFMPNLWDFNWELEDGRILTEETIIDGEEMEPTHNLYLKDIFTAYFDSHQGTLYRLFNEAVKYDEDCEEEEFDEDE